MKVVKIALQSRNVYKTGMFTPFMASPRYVNVGVIVL